MTTSRNALGPLDTGFAQDAISYPNEILAASPGTKLPGGVVLANGARARSVRVGDILAKLSADVTGVGLAGQYIVSKCSELAVAAADAASSITVDDAHPFAIGDTITIDDGSNASTPAVITAINYTTNVITVAVTGGTDPLPINSKVSVTASEQDTAIGIAANRWEATGLEDVTGRTSMYIAGEFKKANLYNLTTSANTELAGVTVSSNGGDIYRIK